MGKRQLTAVGIDDVIIVLGGSDDAIGSNQTSVVQVGRINNAGAITWTSSNTNANISPMPQPRAFGGAAFQAGTFPAAPSTARDWQLFE